MREKRKTDKFGDTGQRRTNTKEAHPRMHSIRTKITLTVVSVIILTVCIVAAIGVISIKKLGSDDADQMIHLTATTGAMNLEQYFESVVPTGSFSRKRDVDVNRLLATRSLEGLEISNKFPNDL